MNHYIFKNISGHIEVYDIFNNFICSADNEIEALETIEQLEMIA